MEVRRVAAGGAEWGVKAFMGRERERERFDLQLSLPESQIA